MSLALDNLSGLHSVQDRAPGVGFQYPGQTVIMQGYWAWVRNGSTSSRTTRLPDLAHLDPRAASPQGHQDAACRWAYDHDIQRQQEY